MRITEVQIQTQYKLSKHMQTQFRYNNVNCWNELPETTRNAKSQSSFKRLVAKYDFSNFLSKLLCCISCMGCHKCHFTAWLPLSCIVFYHCCF